MENAKVPTKMEQQRYRFRFQVYYQGESDYQVFDRKTNKTFTARWRTGTNAYLEKNFNGPREMYERKIIDQLYYLTMWKEHVSDEIFGEFVQFLQGVENEHLEYYAKRMKEFSDNPDIVEIYSRYGPSVPLVKGVAYWNDGCWERLSRGGGDANVDREGFCGVREALSASGKFSEGAQAA